MRRGGDRGGMEIPKAKVIDIIRERVNGEQANQAEAVLPERVDPERQAEVLRRLGLDPRELLDAGPGAAAGDPGR